MNLEKIMNFTSDVAFGLRLTSTIQVSKPVVAERSPHPEAPHGQNQG